MTIRPETNTSGAPVIGAPDVVPLVEARSISKRFGATQALRDVSLTLWPGRVHALVGENGAGKSSIGKVIAGVYHADSGELRIKGAVAHRWDTGRAQRRGIVLIAQELSLVPDRSVIDNVFLGRESSRWGILMSGVRDRFRSLEEQCQFGLDPLVPVGDLRLADQQKVEIMRALARDASVVIMDEPTSSLTVDEAAKLHNIMRWLKEQGRCVVYVTHFLDAVLEHSDEVTVMRDGRVIRTRETAAETKQTLVEAMLGRSLDVTFPQRPPAPGREVDTVLDVRDLHAGPLVRGVSLQVRPGEIVGLAGLVGSGRSEICRAIFGVDRLTSGYVRYAGKFRGHSARSSIAEGIVMIPEDRRSQGLVLARSVRENVTLPHLQRYSRGGVLSLRRERSAVEELIRELDVHPADSDGDVAVFSGGNQQKVLFAKWILAKPRVIILDEPTRGVDIGAKHRIYEMITELAGEGAAVLLVSSELEEVLELSHRVYLVADGQVIDEVDPQKTSMDEVLFRLFRVDVDPGAGGVPTKGSGQ